MTEIKIDLVGPGARLALKAATRAEAAAAGVPAAATAAIVAAVTPYTVTFNELVTDATTARDLSRAYAISATNAPIPGAVSTADRGSKYYSGVSTAQAAVATTASAAAATSRDLAAGYAAAAAAAGYTLLDPVVAATTANITLSGAQSIDGVAVVAGNRVLVKNQTTGANNGVYVAAAGAWARATDFDASAEAVTGAFIPVSGGPQVGGWVMVTAQPVTLGTTALVFRRWNDASKAPTFYAIQNANSPISGSGSSIIFESQAPLGQIGTGGFDEAVKFRITTSVNKFTTPDTYYDNTAGIGLNMTTAYTLDNPNIGAVGWLFESNFKADGAGNVPATESHWAAFTVDGGQVRAQAGYFPHRIADWPVYSGTTYRSAQHVFCDGAGTPKMQFNWGSGANNVDLASVVFRQQTNNISTLNQMNATGTAFVAAPYLNAREEMQCPSPTYFVGSAKTSAVGLVSVETLSNTSAANNQVFRYASTDSVATYTSDRHDVTASVSMTRSMNNAGSGKVVDLLSASGGDTIMTFSDPSNGTGWSIGQDVSDSRAFKIETSLLSLGAANPAVRIDSATVAFGLPMKNRSYTVAGLPAAGTVGAGAEAYCSNETGGAAPVFCDGTNWRRVTDRAIAA